MSTIFIKDKKNKDINIDNLYFLDFLPEAVVVQKDRKTIFCNKEALNILKLDTESDLLGKQFYSLTNIFHDIFYDKTPFKPAELNEIRIFNAKLNCVNNVKIAVELKISNKIIKDENYEFITFRDVTEINCERNKLKEQILLYNTMFLKLPISIFIYDDDKCTFINNKALDILGIKSKKDIIGHSLIEYIHPEDKKIFISMKENFRKNAESLPFTEIRLANRKGDLVTVEIAFVPYTFQDKHTTILFLKDISKDKAIERQLFESKEKYRKLINILPHGICVHDNEKFTYSNDVYAKLIGLHNAKDIIGKTIDEIAPSKYYNSIKGNLNNSLKTESKDNTYEYSFKNLAGKLIDIESKSIKFYEDGKFMTLSTIQDVSEKKRIEQLNMKIQERKLNLENSLEYDRIKTDFFSNISHELRTPLSILLSSLQLINVFIESIDSTKVIAIKNYLGVMKQNCYRLLRLIDNLLDLTKIDSGYYILNLKPQNIVTVVENITLSVVSYMETKSLEIIFDTDIEEKMINCDEDKIERIMLNLLSNAVKFTNPGDKIEVNIYDADCYTIISVKDTGIGIKDDKLHTIFDRFSQADKSLARNREGSGLGLCIVKNLVEMHGGKIEVKSILGLGSEFIIYIPDNIIDPNKELFMAMDPYEKKVEENIERMNLEFSDIYNS